MELLNLTSESLYYHCPYNPAHTMPKKTLIKHITRCPEKPMNYKNCIYNLSHTMHQSELLKHEENCPDRILFDTTVYESENVVRPIPIVTDLPNVNYEDESWEGMEHSGDTLKDIHKKTIVMKAKHGSTKSERKNYRAYLHEHDIVIKKNLQNNNQKYGIKEHEQTEIENKVKNNRHQKVETKPLFIGKRPGY